MQRFLSSVKLSLLIISYFQLNNKRPWAKSGDDKTQTDHFEEVMLHNRTRFENNDG